MAIVRVTWTSYKKSRKLLFLADGSVGLAKVKRNAEPLFIGEDKYILDGLERWDKGLQMQNFLASDDLLVITLSIDMVLACQSATMTNKEV